MKEKTVWLHWSKLDPSNANYWLGYPSGRAAFTYDADLNWVNFYGLLIRPYEAKRGTSGKIIGDCDAV